MTNDRLKWWFDLNGSLMWAQSSWADSDHDDGTMLVWERPQSCALLRRLVRREAPTDHCRPAGFSLSAWKSQSNGLESCNTTTQSALKGKHCCVFSGGRNMHPFGLLRCLCVWAANSQFEVRTEQPLSWIAALCGLVWAQGCQKNQHVVEYTKSKI